MAAVRIVEEKGYDETTVDDIADAVGISQRTFFRYYPTKEDAFLLGHRSFGDLIDSFCPPAGSRPSLASLATIYENQMAAFADSTLDTFCAVQRIMQDEPKLRDALIAREAELSTQLYDRVRAVYPDTDPLTIRVVLEVAFGVFRAARETWRRSGDTSPASLQRVYREARECLQALLAGTL